MTCMVALLEYREALLGCTAVCGTEAPKPTVEDFLAQLWRLSLECWPLVSRQAQCAELKGMLRHRCHEVRSMAELQRCFGLQMSLGNVFRDPGFMLAAFSGKEIFDKTSGSLATHSYRVAVFLCARWHRQCAAAHAASILRPGVVLEAQPVTMRRTITAEHCVGSVHFSSCKPWRMSSRY